MLNILLMIILIIIIFIIILLYAGIRIALIYDKKGSKLKGCLKILILKKIKVYSIKFPDEDKEEEEDEEDEEEHEKTDIKKILKLAKPCFGYFKEFLESFVKCIHVTKLENHLIFGMDSYADTAKYIGYIWSLLIIVNNAHKNARLTAEPSFNGSILDANGNNQLDINLLMLIPPTIKLISKKEVRTLIKGVIDERRNKKDDV
ncbi:DUF2953 domain-containing protein [Methanobrevibacter sp.]|uniref:DUF2953 domain-containing protein n=1 Tax=Methanobrevibacter sp. TaxID=66852 RepID=UPI00388F5DFD